MLITPGELLIFTGIHKRYNPISQKSPWHSRLHGEGGASWLDPKFDQCISTIRKALLILRQRGTCTYICKLPFRHDTLNLSSISKAELKKNRMNWERLHTLRHGSANAYDELPPVGSYRDQARYFDGKSRKERSVCRPSVPANVPSRPTGPSAETLRKIHSIEMFLTYFGTKAFAERDSKSKEQLKSALREALEKGSSGRDANYFNQDPTVTKAKRICCMRADASKRVTIKSFQS